MAPNGTLPLELLDHIFSFLRDDALSLHTCACVNETFLAVAERHIYRHITLHNSAQPSDGHFSTTAPQLSKILAMAPHITKYITSVQVSVTFPGVVKWFMTRSLDDEEIAPALSKLSYLEHLSLTGWKNGHISWHSLHSRLQTSLLLTFGSHTLTEITLNRVDQFPLSAFKSCTTLKNLSIIQCTCLEDNELFQGGEARPRLDSLTVQVSFLAFPTVMDWLLGPNTSLEITGLRFLHIATVSSNCTYISHMLSMCAESLLVLEIKSGGEGGQCFSKRLVHPAYCISKVNTGYNLYTGHVVVDPVGPASRMDLSNMGHLQSLLVAGRVYSVEDFWVGSTGEETLDRSIYSAPFAWLAQIFGAAPSSLTHIRIHLFFNINMISLARVDWGELVQALLSMAPRKHITLLVSFLNINTNLNIDDLVNFLRNQVHLAKLTQKGVLNIVKFATN